MIDRQQFNDFAQNFSKEFIVEIIDIYISENDTRFTQMDDNVANKDFKQLQGNAHSIKGVIGNFCDPVAFESATNLDILAKKAINEWAEMDSDAQAALELRIDRAYNDFKKIAAIFLTDLKKIRQELS
jgi:HPt (histidine-containing phosphotransfer) domain-containing protein